MKLKKYKPKPEESMKYFYILIAIFLVLWWVPSFFLDLGAIWVGLWVVASFLIANFIVEFLRNRRKMK